MPSILFFGATGYVGSSAIILLKKAYPNFHLTVYIRNPEPDEYMTKTVGVDKIVHGEFDDTEKISALAAEHDIVVDCSWHNLSLTRAIIAGLKQRPAGSTRILHHVSGAGNFIDGGVGEPVPNARMFNDANEDDMKLINPSMMSGRYDTEVLEAGKNGIDTYIAFPTAIYGVAEGFVKLFGVLHDFCIATSRKLGFVPYIGAGTNTINSVHVLDVASFLVSMLDFSLSDEPKGSVYERCYILGTRNDQAKDVLAAYARTLHAKGVVPSSEAKSVTLEESGDPSHPFWKVLGGSILFKNERATKLGFKVTQPSWLDSFDEIFDGYEV